MMLELRPYQQAALAAIREQWDAGVRSTLLVQATGTGKTVVFAEVVRTEISYGARTLVLVHRDELLRQAASKCRAVGLCPELEKGPQRASQDARCVIASVQSLRGARLARFDPEHFDVIVIDEAHHATSTTYRNVTDYFVQARVLGVTATPDRADGVGLGEMFGSVAYRYELRQAIDEGYLVPITARRVVLEGVDLATVKSRAGDLAQDELAEVMETEQALRGVVVPLLELARDRRTIAFGVDVAHAVALAAMLNEYRPGCARSVSGSTDEYEREELLAAFERGEFQFLTNCALLTEGYDSPGIACVAMCRPTKSRGLFMQCVGRGTRLAPGKHDLLLLDFTGNAGRHRLVGPIDCLAGDVPDEVRAELDRLFGYAQLDIDDALRQAMEEVARRRQGVVASAVVKYHAEQIDPFIGNELLDHQAPLGWDEERATSRQLEMLEKYGVTTSKLPKSFSMADASRLLARLESRIRAGLCSYKSARRIAMSGIDTRDLTQARATELINILRVNGWRPHALINTPEAVAARQAKRRTA